MSDEVFAATLPPSSEGSILLVCSVHDVILSDHVLIEYAVAPVISRIQPTVVLASRSVVTIIGAYLNISGQSVCFVGNRSFPFMILSSQQGSCVLSQIFPSDLLYISVGINEVFKSNYFVFKVIDSYVTGIFPSVAFDSGVNVVTITGFNFDTLTLTCNFGGVKTVHSRIVSDRVAHCNVPILDVSISSICFGIHDSRCFPFSIVSTPNISMISPLKVSSDVPFYLNFTGKFPYTELCCHCGGFVSPTQIYQNGTILLCEFSGLKSVGNEPCSL